MKARKIAVAIAVATLATGCATNKLPEAKGKDEPINSLATAEMLAYDAGLMVVGTRADDVEARREVLQSPVPEGVPQIQQRKFNRDVSKDELVAMPTREATGRGVELVERTITVPFNFGSVDFVPTPEQQYRIRQLAVVADRVEVRGRTDGIGPNEQDQIIAKARAEAAQRYLIDRGVPNEIIAVNYQAGGDYVGDNAIETGRAVTRRVEIEFFVDQYARNQGKSS